MNTRLQVEHPVTEMITGLDLVEWQIRVAAGEKLPLAQKDLRINGHAIEARIYAEDPSRDFLPAPGRVEHLVLPEESEHVRVETGVRAGDEITAYYDPMIAKLIVWDRDRSKAIERLREALGESVIAGVASNLRFLFRLIHNRDFVRHDLDTGLIERHSEELLAAPEPAGEDALALASLTALSQIDERQRSSDPFSPWGLADGWRQNQVSHHVFVFHDAEREYPITVRRQGKGFELELGGKRLSVKRYSRDGRKLTVQVGDASVAGSVVRLGNRFEVFLPGKHHTLQLYDPLLQVLELEAHAGGLAAPMPGKIAAILVKAGEQVEKGATLLILEAMKMEHTIKAPARGRVGRIRYRVGEQVAEGAELIEFETET
jgi:3-methylcrotonyl-CoA carboxylase alpha subunit